MQRYNMVHNADPSYRTQMLVRPEGKYVRYDAAIKQRDELQAEVERLRVLLQERDGGRHDEDCKVRFRGPGYCDCGHDEVVDALQRKEGDG